MGATTSGMLESLLLVGLLLVGLAVLLGGLVLLWGGLWPRRTGTDPHCRHCGYNLSGSKPGMCPECGRFWVPSMAVKGQRHRRPGRAVTGGLLTAAGCVWLVMPLADRIVGFNYLGLLPTGAVVMFADSSGSPRAQRAIDEMAARLAAGTVSAEDAERFFRRISNFRLEVRPKVIEGETVPYRVVHNIPRVSGVGYKLGMHQLEVDGKAHKNQVVASTSGDLDHKSTGALGASLRYDKPGRHSLRVLGELEYTWTLTAGGKGRCRSALPLEGAFEILPTDSPDTARGVPAPQLAEQLRQCIRPTQCQWTTSGAGGPPGIILTINAREVPVNTAFDAFARVQGQEYPLGPYTLRKGGNFGLSAHGDYNGPPTPTVDIILRSSSAAARHTTDITEFWEGELVYPDVPVTGTWPGAAAASQAVEAARE